MILSLEATICTTVRSNEAKLTYAMTAAVVKSATYLEGSVAKLSLLHRGRLGLGNLELHTTRRSYRFHGWVENRPTLPGRRNRLECMAKYDMRG